MNEESKQPKRQFSFRIDPDDPIIAWMDAQNNISVSLRILVHQAMSQSGIDDYVNVLSTMHYGAIENGGTIQSHNTSHFKKEVISQQIEPSRSNDMDQIVSDKPISKVDSEVKQDLQSDEIDPVAMMLKGRN